MLHDFRAFKAVGLLQVAAGLGYQGSSLCVSSFLFQGCRLDETRVESDVPRYR